MNEIGLLSHECDPLDSWPPKCAECHQFLPWSKSKLTPPPKAVRTREHSAWFGVRGRCSNPKDWAYGWYGGRGISVCERWQNSFSAFLEDMGPCPEGLSLDRIDNDGNYEPGNCRWTTRQEQVNNRSNTVRLVFNGKVQGLTYWARELGVTRMLLYKRLERGWTVRQTLTEPYVSEQLRIERVRAGIKQRWA